MKIAIAVTAAILIAATSAAAKPAEPADIVTLCADRSANLTDDIRARAVATGIFAGIGVRLEWHMAPVCPENAVHIKFSYRTPPSLQPGALAYAICGGTQIVVFDDRVAGAVAEKKRVPVLLGHVLAHEVSHILQGVARHSQEGVMKAHWTEHDYAEMSFKPLTFTQDDITLIHAGFKRLARRTGTEAKAAVSVAGN
jgi:hypothetical protein